MDRLNDVLRHRTTLYLMLAFFAALPLTRDAWSWLPLLTATVFVLCALLELLREQD